MKLRLSLFSFLFIIFNALAGEYKSPVIKINNYPYKKAHMKREKINEKFKYRVQEYEEDRREIASEDSEDEDSLDNRSPSNAKGKEKEVRPIPPVKPWEFKH